MDTTTAPRLEELFDRITKDITVLNLEFSKLDYISSAGLRVLLRAQKTMNKQGKIMKEVSMEKIAEMNTAFVELVVEDTKRASYVLAEKLELNNFKIVDSSKIRIYETKITTQEISKEIMANGPDGTLDAGCMEF